MNAKNDSPEPKAPSSHLHSLNLIVALLAGIISITGGVYSLKSNLFSSPEYGSLQGIVRDEKIAKPLKLVSVEIADLTGAVVNTVSTDDDGHYKVESLKTGNYAVKFTAPLHKVETKAIKIEKNLESSINVDLVPDMPAQPVQTASLESPVAQTITPTYPAATPATASYNANGTMTQATTVPATYAGTSSSTYTNSNQSAVQQDQSDEDSQYSGFRHSRRGPPGGGFGGDSSSSSGGSSLATVGTQLLSALISKKADN